jgi:uncharacterized iron-regulated membrane protein
MIPAAPTDIPVPEAAHSFGFWSTWWRHPQKNWLRRLVFQVHLWTGIILSLYVLLMSVSGTILIYRVEISKASVRPPVISPGGRPLLSKDQLTQFGQQDYPAYQILSVTQPRKPDQPAEISLQRGEKQLARLFDPYTGADLGDSVSRTFRFIEWLTDLHDNLLDEPVGRIVNGIGGVATILLCLTGVLIWWPGSGRWRRALTVSWKADARSFNWGLHRAVGIWSLAFIFLWGFSGIYLAVPEPFETAVAFLDPPTQASRKATIAEQSLSWLARLHFGRFGGMSTKLIWTLFGLAPIALVITGLWMWWARVVRPKLLSHKAFGKSL